MNRTPLRAAYAAATVSTLLALSAAEPALGHVDVRPRLVEQGSEAVLRVELPQLRAGGPPVRLDVEGDGVTVLASSLQAVAGAETLWSVRIRVGAAVPPGELLLVLRAVFADDESVEVDGGVIVVPPAEEQATGGFPWPLVAAGVSATLAFAAGALLVARRRGAW